VKGKPETVHRRFDIHTLERQEATTPATNVIAEINFHLA
jgi:hypothetical protein